MIISVVYWISAVVAVAAGAAVFVVNSMARATYALAASFVAVGVAVLLLAQNYIGVVTILMMVMEMAVMAVYMVMFMGMNPALMPMSMVHDKRHALAAAAACFVVLASGILLTDWPARSGAPPQAVTFALGEELMGPKMLAMVVISPVMVATIVAAVVLAAHRSRYDRFGDDLKHRPARDPQPGGVGR
ncbi:NADH:ubiquinone oxidoreductase subunit J [Mycobacterium simiae]|uniref:NADH-quinone oxidoreductase subunit J n=1 Tax=Mycobacterium simiae TaxID=1784 RepID=A0A5B1BPJ9_MYCSI|nr:NADH-quinone oxidoreductase subunit J [Mycobacterium simiae]KAA1249350.1 NADH:ubiquinone oxidoreductase subunit J [Mycobacterium simiae]